MTEQDMMLRAQVENVFVAKDKRENITQPHVLASMITAASQMSKASEGIATPEMTTEQLLDLYGKKEDEAVIHFLGMASPYIKLNTGYSVEVEDIGAATLNYRVQQATYDEIYRQIAARANVEEKETERTR